RLECDLREAPAIGSDLLPESRQLQLGVSLDEHRAYVVEELVPDGPRHRPVCKPLTRIEDLLDPDAIRAPVYQPSEVAARIGESTGMVEPHPVDHALAHQAQDELVSRLEHLEIELAHAGKVADVEEAAIDVADRIDVEEPSAQLGHVPVDVRVVG